MVRKETSPPVPGLTRRMTLSSCHTGPVRAFTLVLTRMPGDGIALGDILADSKPTATPAPGPSRSAPPAPSSSATRTRTTAAPAAPTPAWISRPGHPRIIASGARDEGSCKR